MALQSWERTRASRGVEEGHSRSFCGCGGKASFPSPSAGDLRELPLVPLIGEGCCGVGGASRDSAGLGAMEEGMGPFGVAYVAAAGHPLAAAVGAFLTYLTAGAGGLVCGAAAVVTLACRMVLEGTALSRRRGFFPGCAALAMLFTKGVVAAAGDRKSTPAATITPKQQPQAQPAAPMGDKPKASKIA